MEYNYYMSQPGHPPAAPNQHGGPQLQQQGPPPSGQMMHAPMPLQNVRQAMPSGPPNHHQQMQQHQQHIGHHSQQMPPQQQQQQQQHPNYHHIQPVHSHGPPVSHSGSPHPQQQHHNHQPTLSGPPPQSAIQSQQQHMHPQSPHHHGGPPMHMQQQQPMNQMARPPLGPSNMNHPQPGLQQPTHHHQNFFGGGMNMQPSLQHYPQQNQHHPIHQQQHHHHHQHHQPPIMHHAPPMATHHPHMQQGVGRNSPYYPNCILQTEFRIIELNRRLQCRPVPRHPVSPLPSNPFDESLWWERFASEFFEDDATLTIRIQDDKPVDYTIGRTLIPRFFRSYFSGGVTDLSINLRNPKEACIHPQLITLDCDQAFIVTNNVFRHPAIPTNQAVVVHTEGHLILDFVNSFDSLSIKSWRFYTKGCREYIDRSMTAMGLPNAFLVEPVTRQGLTKSTISYLKMCMIMEPMQDLMFQHRQSKMDPRSCLRKLLFDRYKFKSGDDNRVATNKRRKRKPSAVPAITGAATTKKSKANVTNSIGTNSGLNNSINMMSPSGAPSFSLASQDVMVVGEPSMMGGDFGDDNERMITRLENTQYDPTASTPSNTEESDSMNTSTGNDNGLSSSSNNIDSSIEIQNISPSMLQQRQQQQHQIQQPVQQPVQPMSSQNQMEKSSPPATDQQHQQAQLQRQQQQPSQPQQQQHQRGPLDMQDQIQEESVTSQINQVNLIEHPDMQQHEDMNQLLQQPLVSEQLTNESDQISEDLIREDPKQHEITNETTKLNSILEATNDPNLMIGVEQMENHSNSLQPSMNDESNSNSLPCSTATTTAAIEQQQAVNNGVA